MPRKTSQPSITPMPELNQEAIREDIEALSTLNKVAQDIGNEQLQVAQFIGQRLGRRSMVKLLTTLLS